jgi:hypothetical protein
VEFTPIDATAIYKLQWKQHHEAWNPVPGEMELSAGVGKAEAVDLLPGTTYCLRLVTKDGSLAPGPELILDTEQVGCTPKANKSCCVIL